MNKDWNEIVEKRIATDGATADCNYQGQFARYAESA